VANWSSIVSGRKQSASDLELEDGHPGELCCEDDANLCSDGDPGVGYN
jgi:hypothetical protein